MLNIEPQFDIILYNQELKPHTLDLDPPGQAVGSADRPEYPATTITAADGLALESPAVDEGHASRS